MVIDDLSNAEKYFCLHPLFERAFSYIQSVDLMSIGSGRYEIRGNQLYGIVSNKPGKTREESLKKFECHDRYIDIQVCIDGNEEIGWKPRSSCKNLKESYDPEKDVSFFEDAPDMYFQLRGGQFAIFFPGDVHAPMIGGDEIRKLVIKVKI